MRLWRIVGLVPLAGCSLLTDFSGLKGDPLEAFPGAPEAGTGAESGADAGADTGAGPLGDAGIGTGRSGSIDVSSDMVVNDYAALSASAKAGETTLTLDDASNFNHDDAVLVWQSTGLPQATSGAAGTVDLGPTGVGRFEIVRVDAKSGATLTLTSPLTAAYPASMTQAVRVPEYLDVNIHAAGVIRAAPWDGTKGGIAFMTLTGRLHNDGAITADGTGFRGGRGWLTPNSVSSCPSLDGTPSDGHAAKGEGPYVAGFTPSSGGGAIGGRGNFASGAGGGNCHNAGGGGGGHGGAGGIGGRSGNITAEDLVGGNGGAALVYDPLARLVSGGGGGSGDADAVQGGGVAINGGAGGGVVFIRASYLEGAGTISADGESGAEVNGNGGGGGGAGGLVVIDALETASCANALRANGGDGSNVISSRLGTAGGGGGGRVLLRARSATCTVAADPGKAGAQSDSSALDGLTHGAAGGARGIATSIGR